MKKVTVEMGGQEYEITCLPYRQSREWREKFAEPIERIVGGLQFTGELLGKGIDSGQALGDTVGALGKVLLGDLGKTLLGSVDLCAEMLFAYAPNLDRAAIEENAYDEEILKAFVEVLKLAYPFSEILASVLPGRSSSQTRKK